MPTVYQIGLDLPFSVYISTNQGLDAVTNIEKTLKAGGYQVMPVSLRLNNTHNGITIHNAGGAEARCSEVSQRIMTETGIAPTIKKMELTSDNDLIIWYGN